MTDAYSKSRHRLKAAIDAIRVNNSVDTDQWDTVNQTLRYEQPIERIAVMKRESSDMEGVRHTNWK